MNLYLINY